MVSSLVGSVESLSLIVAMDASASRAETPRDCITTG